MAREAAEPMHRTGTALADALPLTFAIYGASAIFLGLILSQAQVDFAALPAVYPVAVLGSGLLLALCATWLFVVGDTLGTLVAGTFSGFWLSLGVLGLAMVNNWLKIPATENTGHIMGLWLMPWAFTVFLWFMLSVRMPFVHTLFYGVTTAAFSLLIAAFWSNFNDTLSNIAGYLFVASALVGYYIVADIVARSLGYMGLPEGKPASMMAWPRGAASGGGPAKAA